MNGELPKGWVWTSLDNCVNILDNKRIPINSEEREKRINGKDKAILCPYYGATGQVGWIDDYIFDEELILLGEDGAPFLDFAKDKAYLINGKSWVNNHAHVIKSIRNICTNSFICHYLNTFDYRNYITGTTRYKLNQSLMKKIPIPLPPLSEQQRIVNKIEELFTNLDKGVESLNEVKSKLKIYRQAILKYAMEGKLSEKWREENKDKIEPASNSLENINIKRELPYGWTSTYLKNIILEIKKINPKENPDSVFIYVDIASIDNNKQKIISPKTYFGKEAPSRARQLVKEGDIIFSTVRTYLRNIAIVTSEFNNQVVSTGFCVLRTANSNYKWLFYLVQTDFFLNPLTEIQRGTNYPAVRNSDILSQIIPFPPLEEQNIIVERIEKLFSLADYIEETVDSKLEQSKNLRQSILKKAFEGKLVPQDPNDEPAEILLEKIKKQRLNKEKIVQEKLV